MLDTYRIKTRIEEIRKRIDVLEQNFKNIPESRFLKDYRLNAEAEHHLQVAIQACIDIASHIVAVFGLERAAEETYEVFESLAQENIIPKKFLPIMRAMTGYRNIVVHDYLSVKRRITYDNIQKRLPDLSKFAQYIEEFLEKQKPKA